MTTTTTTTTTKTTKTTRRTTTTHFKSFLSIDDTILCCIHHTLSLSSLSLVSISPSRVVTVQLYSPPTLLQATSSHLQHTHTSLETPAASLALVAHLADTMLRCWAPPLEAVDHLRCPLRCPPRPYFPSRCIVGHLLSSLVMLSTTRDCLTC